MKKQFWLFLALILFTINACNTTPEKEENTEEKEELSSDSTAKEDTHQTENIDPNLSQQAKLMAGLDFEATGNWKKIKDSDFAQNYRQKFQAQWTNLENQRLNKILKWRDSEIADLNKEQHTLFYPFSGPDLLNAYLFFPNCDNYLMFGLEPIGTLPDLSQKDEEYTKNYLSGIQRALSVIFQRNYFITSFMGGNLHEKNTYVQGVTPIITTFLARTGNDIVRVEKFVLMEDGKPDFMKLEAKQDTSKEYGLHIAFKNEDKEKVQHLYYFGTDVRESQMPKKPELISFIKSFENKITFVKSASYLLHGYEFKTMRELILSETSAVLQDDTGIPYAFYMRDGWNVQLYGKYARPVAEADFKNWYQRDLQQRYNTDKNVKSLDFTFGYHWNTDKTSVLLCKKK